MAMVMADSDDDDDVYCRLTIGKWQKINNKKQKRNKELRLLNGIDDLSLAIGDL